RLVATYEYAPYGEILASSGDFAAANPFRFSTKYHDDETGLVDFGRRLYDPLLGRWINRDPIGEDGGVNLYAHARNDPVNRSDYLGACPLCVFGFCLAHGGPPETQPTAPTPPTSGPTTAPATPCVPTVGKTCTGTTNGCGSEEYKVPDNPFAPVSFRAACDQHDLCYATIGKTKEECDEEFLVTMRAACRAAGHTEPEEQRFTCLWWAKMYYEAVRTSSASQRAYDETQRREREYWEDWLRNNPDQYQEWIRRNRKILPPVPDNEGMLLHLHGCPTYTL
ncbi:MAG: RHS repeat-associated core domain-containing protein, partial [Phycisphaerae bacterium]